MMNPTDMAEKSPTPSELLSAALAYAQRGIPVIPLWSIVQTPTGMVCGCGDPRCSSPGKHPIGKLVPHGLTDATVDEVTLTLWWLDQPYANIGLVMGEAAGIIVVDIDGDTGRASVKGKPCPPGPKSETGGGGEHRFYQWPGSRVPPAVGILPKVDIRGDGSYAVAPPSHHLSGKNYRWAEGRALGEVEVPACPEWVLDLLKKKEPQKNHLGELSEDSIPEGERNARLASLAGTMRRRDMSVDEIETAISKVNADRCNPPLGETEVREIARSISRYEPVEVDDPYAMQKDYGHAVVLGELFANRFRWAIHRGSWMEYDLGVWRPISEEYMSIAAADALRRQYVAELSQAKDKQHIDELTSRIRETCIFARIAGALSFLKGRQGILTRPKEWDRNPWLFNVANGTLDLKTGELHEHDANDLLTKLAPVNYDPQATSRAWETHLDMFLPEPKIRRQVQRSLGVALVGTTLEEKLDLWYGIGANGKTTTARALMAVCGDYTLRAAPDLLIASKHDRHPAEIADLAGSRLVFSVEVDEGKKMAEALVKDLTGGDVKKARYMYQDFFQFEQTFSIMLITNHKPAVTGTDVGIWRRIRLIPWEHAVTEYQGRRRPQEEVVSELIDGGSAILNWLLAGLTDWQHDHEWTAPEVQAATEAYRQEEDVLGGFLADCCELGPRYVAQVSELYEAYTTWCTKNGEEPMKKAQFGKFLRRRGITQIEAGHENMRSWKGIRIQGGNQDEAKGLDKIIDTFDAVEVRLS